MSKKPCTICNGSRVYGTPERECFRCKDGTVADAWHEPANPPIDLIRSVARDNGYAIGVHGTQARDYDIIAVPWVEDAASVEELVAALCRVLNAQAVGGPPSKKPLGRTAYTLQIEGWFKLIDISITPRGQHEQ
jgi:hypothetical protein